MSPSPLRASSWLVLCLLFVGSPLRSALAADDFQRYLAAAVQLYENLEYERALAQVQRARTVARGVEQDVSLGLHEGIFLAEMGRWDEARTSFETALLLEPTARLPLSVSPKVERHFESIRQDVNTAIARREQGATPGSAAPATTEAKPPEQELVAEAKPPEQEPVVISDASVEQKPEADAKPSEQKSVAASDRPEQALPVRLSPPEPSPALTPTAEIAQRGMPVLPIVLFGTGVVVGSIGGYFAGGADRSSTRAEDETTAGIMFGIAGTAFLSSVVSWIVMQADTPTGPVAANSVP
ncbi:hypothetical protein [Archangium lipolyticum]|uniref:hypothetical protein n=1 Tax=Archangium lipolyticum TaxID=2970465 RepID=UPI002149D455|nr:hypothetical protein [Archangium lipolyticum]